MRTPIENQYLLASVDAINRSIIVVSTEFKILAANKYALSKLGSDIVGKSCHQVYHGKDTPCVDCPGYDVISKGEFVKKNRNFTILDIGQVTCCPIKNEKDEVEALIITDFDTPHIGLLEEKLARTNSLLENMLNSAVDAVIAADMTGRIFIFNEAAQEISGYSEMEAMTEITIRDLYPEGWAYEVMRRMRSDGYGGKGKVKEFHIDLINKKREGIPISLYATIIYENGEEVASIGFFHDQRDRNRIRNELEKIQTQLYQAEKMSSLGKLAAGVAHQINNPLGGITLFTKLILEEYNLPEDARQDLNRILKDAQRCRTTVKELLEFARQSRHDKKPTELNRTIERTLFLVEGHTIFHNIQIEKDLSSDVSVINADVHQINHVLLNIIFNAAQSMEGRGRLTIRTRNIENGRVAVEVADTGPGIPAEILPHIFEPFFTTKEEGKGTGLGLSLAYGIVEDHGGTITASNRPEGGAVFTITLPIDNTP
jgi:two-component system, NtrC family, sensor kinase